MQLNGVIKVSVGIRYLQALIAAKPLSPKIASTNTDTGIG